MDFIKLPLKAYIAMAFFAICLLHSSASIAGKAECQPYLDKLHHVQSLQRAGYSAKQGERLKRREEKARDKWWQCSRGKLKTKTSKRHKKAKHKQTAYAKSGHAKLSKAKEKQQKYKASRAYATNSVVVKQRYQGEQLMRWHQFYQKPKKCQRPKTMQQFSYCIEDKNRQELAFEQHERSLD